MSEVESLAVEQTWVGETAWVTLSGELTQEDERRFLGAVEDALDGGPERLVLNLAAVSFIDSAGLGALVRLRQRAIDLSTPLSLVAPAPQVLGKIESAGLVDAFELLPSS